MTDAIKFRHVVSIAGVVHEPLPPRDGANGNANGDNSNRKAPQPRRVANAAIEIIVDEAPRAFQTMVNARRADPAFWQRRERIDRTWSQTDGVFYFLDLPAGAEDEGYRLRISVPQMGTRYGVVETEQLTVHANPDGDPVQMTWVDIEMSPTRIHGTVSYQTADATLEPVIGAKVYLRGDTRFEITDDNGNYELTRLVASRPTLEVVADGFAVFRKRMVLQPGQAQEENVRLQVA